ncbi:unnamed protein product [Nezara viridula]|uniref:Uncharacterized protein n=1 Tax=Nezara viridula TaxID=85310 RepID=A0A9P0H3J7_NEZVI|nr:unnamed protein product [Nezara viridula]
MNLIHSVYLASLTYRLIVDLTTFHQFRYHYARKKQDHRGTKFEENLDPGNDSESGREPGVAIDRLRRDVTTMTPSGVTSASGSPMGREARVTSSNRRSPALEPASPKGTSQQATTAVPHISLCAVRYVPVAMSSDRDMNEIIARV